MVPPQIYRFDSGLPAWPSQFWVCACCCWPSFYATLNWLPIALELERARHFACKSSWCLADLLQMADQCAPNTLWRGKGWWWL